MENINIQDYKIHPIYTRYAADSNACIVDLYKKRLISIHTNSNGYNQISIRIQNKPKMCSLHRFTYECFNGIIPENKVIDHIDNNKSNNNINNLQLMTQQENCKKSANNRDYTFVANNHKNKKLVKSTCIETGEIDYFHSLYSIERDLKINCGIVKMCCEKLNRVKSGKSKLNGMSYKFEYIDALPDDYNKEKRIVVKKN